MPSQFFGLNIAASGLRAANAALLATGNNIANATTDGYSRQKVEQEASDALRVFTKYGCAGAGVDTLAIERVRDQFYDERFRTNETSFGKYSQRDYYNDLIERYFQDDVGAGFNSLFTRMQADLQGFLTNKTDDSKTNYIGSVRSLTEYFNNTNDNLRQLQQTTNDEIKLACDNINTIASKIVILNQQINTIELTGANANDLRDKRDVLLDELSGFVSVETKEIKVKDTSDPDRDTGLTRFTIHIAGGDLLVDDTSYRQLICVAREPDERMNMSDVDGLYDIKWVSSNYKEGDTNYLGTFDLGNRLMGGKMQGLIDVRDGNNAQYFYGKADTIATTTGAGGQVIPQMLTAPDPHAGHYEVKIKADSMPAYLQDMNKSNVADYSRITIGSRVYHYSEWNYNADGSYTFYVDPPETEGDQAILASEINEGADVRIGRAVDYQGIPYYMAQMNEWVRCYAAAANEVVMGGYTADSQDATWLLTGKKLLDSNAQYSYDELTSTNKKYQFLTAGNFQVNDILLNDPTRLPTKSDRSEGNEQTGTAQALYDMSSQLTIFRNAKAGEFLSKVQADISMNKNNSATMLATYESLQLTIDNQRLSVSGVDKDEEALSLVQYQNAYTLSSKMIQTLTEIYDRLILQTGV
ncbi:MAG: hypothetical protein IJR00_03240 [Lachnospiraceae bacterium]|nr:hypothetical protein [Lachnospiraceae bacterium]